MKKTKEVSDNRKFFEDFSRFNSEKLKELEELKRKIEEFEGKYFEQVKNEEIVYNSFNRS